MPSSHELAVLHMFLAASHLVVVAWVEELHRQKLLEYTVLAKQELCWATPDLVQSVVE